MKPDPLKTKHYKNNQEKKSKLKQQCGITVSFIIPLHMTTPWIITVMHKTQSLCRPGKLTAPEGSHEIITVLLTHIGNGWRETEGNRTATGRRKALCTFYWTPAGLKALKVFQHRSGLLPWISRSVFEPDTAAG